MDKMGNQPLSPDNPSGNDPNTSSPMESANGQDNERPTKSATVVFFGTPVPDLVVETGFCHNLKEGNEEEKKTEQRSLKLIPSSAYVVAQTEAHLNAFGGGGGSPPFGGPFGSGGSHSTPDVVPSSFKLEAIGGLDEEIKYLKRSIILPLVRPEVFKDWGMSPPKGILFHGPPGTGKTFLAKALVNELKKELRTEVNFFYRKGGDVFSMWFGESQRKLREVFAAASQKTPSIIFFDEIDGLCPSRDGANHGTEAYNSVVTCFLGQMDALVNGKVFVIAATNRLDAVDPAVRRPGRFDKHLAFGFPDEEARGKIISIHTEKWSKNDRPSPEVVSNLAKRTIGYSGADLEKLCKDVVYAAMEENGGEIPDSATIQWDHWTKAMSSMQKTAGDSFNSSLFFPTKPNETISLLIQPTVDIVIKKIAPMLSEESIRRSTPTVMKNFNICISPFQSSPFLNTQILQGILCDPIFSKCSMFELSTAKVVNKVLNLQKPTIYASILGVINQAIDASIDNFCVVVVPNVNELIAVCEANQLPSSLILRTLAKIRGPKMLLLATCSVLMEDMKDKRIFELFFDRYTIAENPKAYQLRPFFKAMLTRKAGPTSPHADLDKTLNEVAKKAAQIADNHKYEHILNLSTSLEGVDLQKNVPEIRMTFDDILNKYVESRL